MVYEDINYRYYKEKVIYGDIFSVPIVQNMYKSYRMSFFWESKTAQISLWGVGLGVVLVYGDRQIQFVQYETITPMESPR